MFGGIWSRVINWLDVSSIFPNFTISHATQFGGFVGFLKNTQHTI
jgi:hypothetical protein